ncbi:MAG: HEAT repeat domain-containing protein [candidate division Zixibacteria bacterium]|nr:HEAT repeat domain-containing protein [candidate division Zixibacteria bacterium]
MIKKLFGSLIDVRKGEILLTVLMFTSYYLLLVAYYFLKPARDSLFLVKVDPTQLPVVFIITALVTVPVVTLYNKASRSLRLNKLISITTGILITNLFMLRWLIQYDEPWVYYTFYTWVSIYGALATSQFWLLANAVYNATQAKRIFVLLGLGGIIGAFTGGEVTGFIVTNFGVSTPDLLFICIGILVLSIVLVNVIWRIKPPIEKPRHQRQIKEKKESLGRIFGTIKKSRHLMLIVGIIAMTMMVASFVDYQFKVVSKNAFPTTGELTTFLGHFYGRLSLVSLFLQLLLTYRFIRVMGVSGVITLLPAALILGSISMLFVPGLLAVVLLRGADGSLKYSLDKTGRELLFLPVPLEIKKRTKIFIDMFVDRWFRGVAGAMLLFCTMVLELSIRQISIVVIVLVSVWLGMTLLMRKEYINAFRLALKKRTIDFSSLDINIADGHAIKTLIASLHTKNEREIIYSLDMLSSVTDKRLIEPALKLLESNSFEVRRRAISVLRKQNTKEFIPNIARHIEDSDPVVRLEAIATLCENSDEDRLLILDRYLADENALIRSAAVGCISRYGNDDEKQLITEPIIKSMLDIDGELGIACRVQLAGAFGTFNRPSLRSTLQLLMHDTSQSVVRQTIISLGKLKESEHLPWLIEKLGDRKYRSYAREALVLYGEQVYSLLDKYIRDINVSLIVRQSIPRVLIGLPNQQSVDLLTQWIGEELPGIKQVVIKALNKLRTSYPELDFTNEKINRALINETKTYYEVLRALQLHRNSDTPSGRLLAQALIEKQDNNLELIFRLLGLTYPPQDIYNAYLGLVSNKNTLRANAIEFLDNLLQGDIKKLLAPIFDDSGTEYAARQGERLFNFTLQTKEEALTLLIEGSDTWLKACAIYDTPGIESENLKKLVSKALSDDCPIVKETAELVLANKKY